MLELCVLFRYRDRIGRKHNGEEREWERVIHCSVPFLSYLFCMVELLRIELSHTDRELIIHTRSKQFTLHCLSSTLSGILNALQDSLIQWNPMKR